jgi:hypothetical protein
LGRRLRLGLGFAATVVLLSLSTGSNQSLAAETHSFDPVLSLTGACGPSSVSAADEVEDPGCPSKHPPQAFTTPCGVATDRVGDIYVASNGGASGAGRVDIFNSRGEFIEELTQPENPCGLAVDSTGALYVVEHEAEGVFRYTPETFPPSPGDDYGLPVRIAFGQAPNGVAVDPTNDHVFVSRILGSVSEYEPDGTLVSADEVQRLSVDAAAGSFNLALFVNGEGKFIARSGAEAGEGTLTAGSPMVTSFSTAVGTGTVSAGSAEVHSLSTSAGRFKVGRQVVGSGIPSGTTIVELTRGINQTFMRLSNNATVGGPVELSSPGPGEVTVGSTVVGRGIPNGTTVVAVGPGTLTLSANATISGSDVRLYTGEASPYETGGSATGNTSSGSNVVTSVASAVGTGTISAGSVFIKEVSTSSGGFRVGQSIKGSGIPAGTTVSAVFLGGAELRVSNSATASGSVSLTAQDPFAPGQAISGVGVPPGTTIEAVASGSLTLSAAATQSGSGVSLAAALPYDATASAVQASLEAVPLIGAGNVLVTGGPGDPGGTDPYDITFRNALGSADTNELAVDMVGLEGGTAEVTTVQPGWNGRFGPALSVEGIDVNGDDGAIYLVSEEGGTGSGEPRVQKVLSFDGTDHHLRRSIDGSPNCPFSSGVFVHPGLALDQSNGDIYFDDIYIAGVVDRVGANGSCLEQLKHSFQANNVSVDLAIDAPSSGQAGYSSPNQGYVFVSSGAATGAHLYAFKPVSQAEPPGVSSASVDQLTDSTATFRAQVDPESQPTTYRFQYVSSTQFDASGYVNATEAPLGGESAGEGSGPTQVAEAVVGLAPETAYHVRLVASNAAGQSIGGETTFTTYPTPIQGLPDHRAYELVTPPDTNGRVPTGGIIAYNNASAFPTPLASVTGDNVVFGVEGGSLPGSGGNGFYETYVAERGQGGWSSHFTGPTGGEAAEGYPGSISGDHRFSTWRATGNVGTLPNGSVDGSNYLRYPDGRFEPIGIGSLGVDPSAVAKWITPDGGKIVFITGEGFGVPRQLESNAPPDGTGAIYERSPGGLTKVVSLLPEDKTPEGGAEAAGAQYLGTSRDGSVVAFKIGLSGPGSAAPMYARIDGTETRLIASGQPTTFAGISQDGTWIFYLRGGDIFRFDTNTGNTTQIGSGGESVITNISRDGSHVYFVSAKQLDGSLGALGADNLYDASAGAVHFVATLTDEDVVGIQPNVTERPSGGLGLWTSDAVTPEQSFRIGPANDPSRSTPSGDVYVFQSHSDLTGYDSEGHSEIYRYDSASHGVVCISCNPTGASAQSNALLMSDSVEHDPFRPVNSLSEIVNVTSDGQQVFFQSADRLVPADSDGVTDVYEWEAPGFEGCQRPAGCLRLISSGLSSSPNYLYGMSPDGHDVFFRTTDVLLPRDPDGTASIYDARVDGGFPEGGALQPPCIADQCQSGEGATPGPAGVASEGVSGVGNLHPRRRHHRCGHRHHHPRRHEARQGGRCGHRGRSQHGGSRK